MAAATRKAPGPSAGGQGIVLHLRAQPVSSARPERSSRSLCCRRATRRAEAQCRIGANGGNPISAISATPLVPLRVEYEGKCGRFPKQRFVAGGFRRFPPMPGGGNRPVSYSSPPWGRGQERGSTRRPTAASPLTQRSTRGFRPFRPFRTPSNFLWSRAGGSWRGFSQFAQAIRQSAPPACGP
jgi:hypothetical protein